MAAELTTALVPEITTGDNQNATVIPVTSVAENETTVAAELPINPDQNATTKATVTKAATKETTTPSGAKKILASFRLAPFLIYISSF